MQTMSSLPERQAPDQGATPCMVVLPAEVTLPEAAPLREQVLLSLAGDGPIRFDFSSVVNIDVAGLQLILSAMQTALRAGRTISVLDSPDALWARTVALAGGDSREWGSQ